MKLADLIKAKSQFFTTKEETETWLQKFVGDDYVINGDLIVNTTKNVLIGKDVGRMPYLRVCFQEAFGNFFFDYCGLKTLEGSPRIVHGAFKCGNNDIVTLEGGPDIVDTNYNCSGSLNLTHLIGAPNTVGRSFYCSHSSIVSFDGAPEFIGKSLFVNDNPKLKSLKDIHKNIKQMDGIIDATDCPIESHVLGLLKIKGLTSIDMDNEEVRDIINKYLPLGNMLDCVDELTDAGFEEYAKL